MRFSLKRIFFWTGYAAVVSSVAAARFHSAAWDRLIQWDSAGLTHREPSLIAKLASSVISGVLVTALPTLLLWLVVRTYWLEADE